MTHARLIPLPDGPYEVTGRLDIAGQDRERIEPPASKVYLCRCGRSANKPFCDGSHARPGWKGSGVSGGLAQRRLILGTSMSLDGFIARRDGVID